MKTADYALFLLLTAVAILLPLYFAAGIATISISLLFAAAFAGFSTEVELTFSLSFKTLFEQITLLSLWVLTALICVLVFYVESTTQTTLGELNIQILAVVMFVSTLSSASFLLYKFKGQATEHCLQR